MSKMTKNPKWQKIMSVTLHISRTIYHVIVIYDTHVSNDNISRLLFHFSKTLIFWVVRGVKRQKNGPKWQKFLSAMLHVSGTICCLTVFYDTNVSNDNISRCFFQFFKILIFRVVRWAKEQKMVQNDKKCDFHLWYAFVKW